MELWRRLWRDERGSVMTAELAVLGTVGVIGGVVGLGVAARSVNEELSDAAHAFRSLNQTYCVSGFRSCGACVAGSSFVQEDVKVSLAELDAYEERLERAAERERAEDDRWERRDHGERGFGPPPRGWDRPDDRRDWGPDRDAERARPRLVPQRRDDRGRDRRRTNVENAEEQVQIDHATGTPV